VPGRDRRFSGPPRPRAALAACAAALIALALALPAAAPAAEFPLTINTAGGGEVGCKVNGGEDELCEPEYPAGTVVRLVPEPEEGWALAHWSGDCSGSGICQLTMNASHSVTATFEVEQLELKVKTLGTGKGAVKCSTGGAPGPCAAKYPYGTEITLYAESEASSELGGWELEGSEFGEEANCEEPEERECTLTVEENTVVKAVFNLQPLLKIELNGSGMGTVECEVEGFLGACEPHYPKGTEVVLVADPQGESKFAGWSGDCSGAGKEPECELAMEASRQVVATFTVEYTLTVEGTGPGTVSSLPGSIHCGSVCSGKFLAGAKVTLTAAPASGALFDGWAGGGCKGIGTCTVTVNGDITVAAEFEPKPPPDREDEEVEVEEGTARAAATAQVKAGKAALKLTCSGGPCKGALQLSAKVKQGHKLMSLVIGKAGFDLAAGKSNTVEVKLSGPAKQELAKGKTIKAKLSGTGIAARTVTLKAPGGK
jgi:hypothetical protein